MRRRDGRSYQDLNRHHHIRIEFQSPRMIIIYVLWALQRNSQTEASFPLCSSVDVVVRANAGIRFFLAPTWIPAFSGIQVYCFLGFPLSLECLRDCRSKPESHRG